ncbi:YdiU family protein [Aliidiomarina taiwanensis]|uniref:Protein nucleotidyltransferase YdiU n=1 Tax=Aliidiomarina taiwanensis TaxID=946228 RepID=A0A432X0Z0_9GAMM|nr:YdiU family protein [Aliidiomarina taiwanensis]RUO39825.1 YdiU family protein [Aliidiomarina taiwanensis]
MSARYLSLSPFFYSTVKPTPVPEPQWIAFNQPLADSLQLPAEIASSEHAAAVSILAGNTVPSWATPFSQAYSGHQFGHFNPTLGDGRAIVLLEAETATGELYDIQLKGAGRTPYSRSGDGRSPIGPVLREYLVSETMHTFGVPTTRALAAVATGGWVRREESAPGAILTRVASSHIRVGTFQYAASQGGKERVQELADYVIQRHYPHLQHAKQPYFELIKTVMQRQARLVSHWMSLGFIHGVMNTDNCSVAGETIDYGPCAFMEQYNAQQVFSFIDKRGRYRYDNQPHIAQWNMARFAESLAELVRLPDETNDALIRRLSELVETFPAMYEAQWLQRFGAKIGLAQPTTADTQLIKDLLSLFAEHAIDFTLGFRYLIGELKEQPEAYATRQLFADPAPFLAWRKQWQQCVGKHAQALMAEVNPVLIPRNHHVEAAIQEAQNKGQLERFHKLLTALQTPFNEQHLGSELAQPANAEEQVTTTFCGT